MEGRGTPGLKERGHLLHDKNIKHVQDDKHQAFPPWGERERKNVVRVQESMVPTGWGCVVKLVVRWDSLTFLSLGFKWDSPAYECSLAESPLGN